MTSTPTAMVVSPPAPAGALGQPIAGEVKNPARYYLFGRLRSETGRATQTAALEDMCHMLGQKIAGEPWTIDTCPWAKIGYDEVMWLVRELQEKRTHYRTGEKLRPATINRYLSAIRGVMHQAYMLRMVDADHYTRVRAVEGARGSRLKPGRALSAAEIKSLCTVCDKRTPIGARDRALVMLLYQCGLRGFDASGLDLSHWNPGTSELRIVGKGNKERVGWVVDRARSALDAWLAHRGDAPGPLFLPIVGRWGMIARRRKRLTVQAIRATMRRLARLVVVTRHDGKHKTQGSMQRFTPHDLRRTVIGDMIDSGVDFSLVQQFAGHASIETTQQYDRRPAQRLQDAVRQFSKKVMQAIG